MAAQIIFNEQTAIPTELTQHGQKFNQVIPITGANDRTIDVTFSWIRNNDGIVRLVTGIPTKEGIMFSDYDVVIAVNDLSTNVRKGSVGAILMCFDNDDYEVEFINEKGDSLEVLTVAGSDLALKEKATHQNDS